MNVTRSLAELQHDLAVLELGCIDRMRLNAYVPKLALERVIAALCRGYGVTGDNVCALKTELDGDAQPVLGW